jgi:hypothetical protein
MQKTTVGIDVVDCPFHCSDPWIIKRAISHESSEGKHCPNLHNSRNYKTEVKTTLVLALIY